MAQKGMRRLRLLELRKAQDPPMTQVDVTVGMHAAGYRCALTSIHRWENGDIPGGDMLLGLAYVLGCSLDDLFEPAT